MKGKYCIFLLFILVALISCNDPKPVTDTLHRAEALMNEYPDSAWTLLNTISPDEMGQNRNRALYALLYTQAQDKTYRDETNDSLISVAVDYYRNTDNVRHKFLSYYYKGRVHFNAKDYLSATTCYMEAEQLAKEVDDDYLVGLLYAELGRIYNIYYDYPKSLEAYQKAAECYERAGKIRHRNYMWLNQSLVYRNLNRFEESEKFLRKTLESAQEKGDNTLIKSCMGNLVLLYIEEKRMQQAQELYVALESVAGINYGSASFMGKLAQMYASKDGYVEALSLLERGWACAEERMDSVNLYMSSSSLLAKQGKNDLAYQELLKGVTLQNKEAKQTLQQPVLTAQRDYLSEKLEFEAYRLRMEKHLRMLYQHGSLFLVRNGFLLYHAAIPLNEDGSFMEVDVCGVRAKGKALMDRIDQVVRRAYFGHGQEKADALDYMLYLWCGFGSPLYHKDKMSTFERYFIGVPELEHERKGAYYTLADRRDVCEMILREFGLDAESGRIINGHIPVRTIKGETPMRAEGKRFVIDGGFSKPYQEKTGISGYTLIYNSHGIQLVEHEKFESREQAASSGSDIHLRIQLQDFTHRRIMVRDTDRGRELIRQVSELQQLLQAYQMGWIEERNI